MRFDTPIYFQTITPGEYDAETGNYAPDTIAETKRYASVTDSGTEMLKLVYGGLKQGSLTIRMQQPYKSPFEQIRIGDKLYRVDMSRRLYTKQTFVVSEVQ